MMEGQGDDAGLPPQKKPKRETGERKAGEESKGSPKPPASLHQQHGHHVHRQQQQQQQLHTQHNVTSSLQQTTTATPEAALSVAVPNAMITAPSSSPQASLATSAAHQHSHHQQQHHQQQQQQQQQLVHSHGEPSSQQQHNKHLQAGPTADVHAELPEILDVPIVILTIVASGFKRAKVLDKEVDQVIELAAIVADPTTRGLSRRAEFFNRKVLLPAPRQIHPKIARTTGLNAEMYRQEQPFHQVFADFKAFLKATGSPLLVCHNAKARGFPMLFSTMKLNECTFDEKALEVIDTLPFFRRHQKTISALPPVGHCTLPELYRNMFDEDIPSADYALSACNALHRILNNKDVYYTFNTSCHQFKFTTKQIQDDVLVKLVEAQRFSVQTLGMSSVLPGQSSSSFLPMLQQDDDYEGPACDLELLALAGEDPLLSDILDRNVMPTIVRTGVPHLPLDEPQLMPVPPQSRSAPQASSSTSNAATPASSTTPTATSSTSTATSSSSDTAGPLHALSSPSPSSSVHEHPTMWQACDDSVVINPAFQGPQPGFAGKSLPKTPLQAFRLLFTKGIVRSIIEDSIAHMDAITTSDGSGLFTEDNFNRFIAVLIAIGLRGKEDRPQDMWARESADGLFPVEQHLSEGQFTRMLRYLQFGQSPRGRDRLFKARPLIERLNKRFAKVFHAAQDVAVGEDIIPLKVGDALDPFLSFDPARFGLKVHKVSCARTGYVKFFHIAQGRADPNQHIKAAQGKLGYGAAVVVGLLHDAGLMGRGHCVFAEKSFTSVPLAQHLLSANTFMCGRTLPECPAYPAALAHLPGGSLKPGQFKMMKAGSGSPLLALAVREQQLTHYLATFVRGQQSVLRFREGEAFSSPRVREEYLSCSALSEGAASANYRASPLRIRVTSKTNFYNHVFFYVLDVAITNARIIYNETAASGPNNQPVLTEFDFRAQLFNELLAGGVQDRPQSTALGALLHRPCRVADILKVARRTCAQCHNDNRKTRQACAGCKVPLHEGCWVDYHS